MKNRGDAWNWRIQIKIWRLVKNVSSHYSHENMVSNSVLHMRKQVNCVSARDAIFFTRHVDNRYSSESRASQIPIHSWTIPFSWCRFMSEHFASDVENDRVKINTVVTYVDQWWLVCEVGVSAVTVIRRCVVRFRIRRDCVWCWWRCLVVNRTGVGHQWLAAFV